MYIKYNTFIYFMNDSHIEPQYQPYLANKIAELLLNSNEK